VAAGPATLQGVSAATSSQENPALQLAERFRETQAVLRGPVVQLAERQREIQEAQRGSRAARNEELVRHVPPTIAPHFALRLRAYPPAGPGDSWLVTVEDETDGSIEIGVDPDPLLALANAMAPFIEG
jgi:hypothetical protein